MVFLAEAGSLVLAVLEYGDYFFEYPWLILLAIAVLTVIVSAIFAYRYYRYLLAPRFPDSPKFAFWPSVLAVFILLAVVFSVTGWAFYRYWRVPQPFDEGQIGILVAEVPDQNNREQQVAYQNAIIFQFQHTDKLRELGKVKLLGRPLPPDADAQQAEALKIGRWVHAAFVLRPFVVEGTQQPWLTVVNPQNIFQPESSLGQFSTPQLATLARLPFLKMLPNLPKPRWH